LFSIDFFVLGGRPAPPTQLLKITKKITLQHYQPQNRNCYLYIDISIQHQGAIR
jgi:hypothetical protein